jgi:hypothetical protein
MNYQTIWEIIFDAIAALAMLIQGIVVLVAYFTVRNGMRKAKDDIHELRTAVTPILAKSRDILEMISPRAKTIRADITSIAETVKEQKVRISATTDEILARVHRQRSRVDHLATNAVDGVEHASNVFCDSVAKPVRQIGAVLACAKAFFSVLSTGRRLERPVGVASDQDPSFSGNSGFATKP